MRPPEGPAGPRLADWARSRISDDRVAADFGLAGVTRLDVPAGSLRGASVLVRVESQIAAAAAMIELDGVVRRLLAPPPGLSAEDLESICEDAEIDAVVVDRGAGAPADARRRVATVAPAEPRPAAVAARPLDTEWVLLTSGTSGRPKLVAHTLEGLCGAIPRTRPEPSSDVWSTFYDIRRYGGLQIFLRAVLGGRGLALTGPAEDLDAQLARLAAAGVTMMSGTPSHWRKVLMSPPRPGFAPAYVRLSGETADQGVLDGLRSRFPAAKIEHAYASTEAGVGFAVDDGLAGFPAALLDNARAAVHMKVVDGSLRIRSSRAAGRYLGAGAPALKDAEGFVDTGDLVERRGDRVYFLGRKGGIINVGGQKVAPEEVEAVLNAHELVAQSRVSARRNPITGSVVAAEVVPRRGADATEENKRAIVAACRERLAAHKVPATLRFVDHIALTGAGKIGRAAHG